MWKLFSFSQTQNSLKLHCLCPYWSLCLNVIFLLSFQNAVSRGMGPGKPFIYTLSYSYITFFLSHSSNFWPNYSNFYGWNKVENLPIFKKNYLWLKNTLLLKKKVNLEVKRSVIMHFNYFLNYKILLMPNKLGLLSLHNTRHTLIFLLQNSKTI